jgi:hypothetical protein
MKYGPVQGQLTAVTVLYTEMQPASVRLRSNGWQLLEEL